MSAGGRVDAVLFDLDGTLADTAPDLIAAVNRVVRHLGRAPVPQERLRPLVSQGGMALLQAAMPDWDPSDREPLEQFLEAYRQNLCVDTRLFDGIEQVLAGLDRGKKSWGIVTNKPGWLTEPLLDALGLAGRAAVAVSGDTLAVRKPDAGPVLHACRLLKVQAQRVALVGDDSRDVQAAQNAGAMPLLVEWGYGSAAAGEDYPAVCRVSAPRDLLPLLELG